MTRALALACSFIVMEALALFVVGAVMAGAGNRSGLVFPAYLTAELGGFLLVRGLFQVDLPQRLLVVAGGVVSVVALVTIAGLAIDPGAFPPGWAGVGRFLTDPAGAEKDTNAGQFYGIVLLVFAWARGVMVAQLRLERGLALRSFSVGVVVLLGGLLFGHDSKARGAVDGASLPLVAAGLLTLTLIHLRDARPSTEAELRGPWVTISLGTIAALVIAGGAIGVLPLGPLGFVYDHLLGPALRLVLFVVAWTLIIVSFPFAWLISVIIARLIQHAPPAQQQNQQQQGTDTAQNVLQRHGQPAAVFLVLAKVLVVVVILAIVAFLAYRLFKRVHRPPSEDEDREALLGEGSLRDDLAALWRSLRPRRPARAAGDVEPALPPDVLAVRRLYVRLLRLAAERGRARPPPTTPAEFAPLLEQVTLPAEAAHLTAAFVRARYGMQAPTEPELAALRDELHRAERNEGRRM